MEKLKEIINLLNLNKIKSIEIIDSKANADTKLMQLYNGIRSGKLKNDDEAKKYLYPNKEDSNAYYKLKHTLRERLFNTVFFIDTKSSKHSDIHNAHLYVQKITALVQILITKGLRQNAIYMAKKGLKTATQYEFTADQLSMLRILRFHDGTMSGNDKKFQEYDSLINETSDLLRSEVKIEGLFFKVLTLYVNNKSTKPFVFKTTSEYLIELEEFIPQKPSANWIYHYAMISITKFMSVNNYIETLSICDETMNKILSLDFKHTKSIVSISGQAISCCIQLKQYEKGESFINTGIKFVQEGRFNWFKFKELHLTLCFHTQNYSKAWEIFNQAILLKKFKKLPSNIREVWKIYEAWLHFFIQADKLEVEIPESSKNFNIFKYANEVPVFYKDKRGLNIPIHISQIALLLQQKKYNAIIDRMEAIEKYKDRYIDKDHNFRSNTFINMLMAIPKASFNRRQTIEKTAKDREKLEKVSIDIANQSADIEILPYEDIWDVLLEYLD